MKHASKPDQCGTVHCALSLRFLIHLQDVRGRIAAIPQEPILFSGSIRSNVDPYSHHDDADIWLALERVNLKVSLQSAHIAHRTE